MMKSHVYILLVLLSQLIVSCGSKRKAMKEQGDLSSLSQRYGFRVTPEDNLLLYNTGARWMGTPHRMGGSTRKGVDCSGFVVILYNKVYDKSLSRSSADMLKNDCRKIKRAKLAEGDLVFFRTDGGRKKAPNHVGVYLKNGKFIHTSTSKGVIVSSLSEPYYLRTWITGGRVK